MLSSISVGNLNRCIVFIFSVEIVIIVKKLNHIDIDKRLLCSIIQSQFEIALSLP